MSNVPEKPADQENRKWKWTRPVITVAILIGILILLTDGEILKPFVYTNF